jgi:hypothetical protein
MTTPDYTFHVGEKFHADGSVRAFPGVTIISFATPDMPIYQAGERLQHALMQQPYGHKFALLPPSSFHMTVFSLVCYERRSSDEWTDQLPLDTPMEEADAFFLARATTVPAPQQLRMCMTFVGGWGMSFRLHPADEATYLALRGYRTAIARATGVRYPDHDTYEFHLSLAYILQYLTDDEYQAYANFRYEAGERLRAEIGVFTAPAPVLTFFDDMFRFVPADERHRLVTRR